MGTELFYESKSGIKNDEEIHTDILGADDQDQELLDLFISKASGSISSSEIQMVSSIVRNSW